MVLVSVYETKGSMWLATSLVPDLPCAGGALHAAPSAQDQGGVSSDGAMAPRLDMSRSPDLKLGPPGSCPFSPFLFWLGGFPY